MKTKFKPVEIEFLKISEEDIIQTSASKPGASTTAPTTTPPTSPVDTADDLPWDAMN